MGIPVIRYRGVGKETPVWGVLRDDKVFPLRQIEAADHRELMALFFQDRPRFDAALDSEAIALAELSLCAPLSSDIQIFCQGLNYVDHRLEGGMDEGSEQAENLLFMKAASSICGPHDDIIKPANCELLDYEIELGLVMRAGLSAPTEIAEDELGQWIGGLVLANDVSARDFMFGAPAMQWFKGKSQRTFCPLGPVLYLLEDGDLDKLYDLELVLKLNGVVKQQASTDLLIHKPAKTLTDIAEFADLRCGDCVLTGTPGGVLVGINLKTALSIILNMRDDEKRRRKFVAAQLARTPFLKAGDVLELEIRTGDGSIDLGRQRSRIVEA
jgi:2-keto-4-pentenoate hydratase/2-oxohepta-3-ene-1,7-dioic acid hydratase in catechol pathway